MENLILTSTCTLPARWNNGIDAVSFAAPCFGGRGSR